METQELRARLNDIYLQQAKMLELLKQIASWEEEEDEEPEEQVSIKRD